MGRFPQQKLSIKKIGGNVIMSTKKKILITSVGGDVACSALRCLQEERDNYEIIGCDVNEWVQGKMYVDSFLVAPRYSNLDVYIDFVKITCINKNVDFFLPIGEREIVIASVMKDFFKEHGIVTVMVNDTIIQNSIDKFKTHELCDKAGVPTPPTSRLTDIKKTADLSFGFPIILKKATGFGAKGMRRVEKEEQLEKILNDPRYTEEGWILQKEVGSIEEEYTMGVFSDGKTTSSLTFRRKLGFGSMSIFVETVNEPQCQEIAEKIANEVNLYGSINIQMRKENGVFHVFEINPRLSSSCRFRHLNGFKDVVWWIQLLDNRHPDISFVPQAGKIGIKTLDELIMN